MPNIFVEDNFYHGTSQACIVDLVPPTFAGINSASVESRGQIRAKWLAATETVSPPVRYEVYVQASTNVGLFNTANIIGITDKLQYDFWQTPDGNFLVNGTTYWVGVRAVDAVGNRDSNTISLSVISTGVFVSAEVYKSEGAFVVNSNNQLQGTLWCLKNSIVATSSNAVMGTASYQVYDKLGNPVPGMGGSGFTADANGQYIITPITSTLTDALEHYMVRVSINVDGANRVGYVPLIYTAPDYDIAGVFTIDTSNNFDGSFWITANEKIRTTGLGTASYQVYDVFGNPVVGMSETGITADTNGIFKITAIPSLIGTVNESYAVRVSINIDSTIRSAMLPIQAKKPEYEAHAIWSINGLNQLQGTLWGTVDNLVPPNSRLGTANYTIYDATGTPVPGLTQSGITPDSNGRFIITPVGASLLSDLTHYTAKVGIVIDGVERVSYLGFTLLGN